MPVEAVLFPVLIQLSVIILSARLVASLFHRMRQPAAVGEIAAGLLLGPSALGYFFPGLFSSIFRPTVEQVPPELFQAVLNWIFSMMSQVGLILLMFLVGLEFDFGHLRRHGKSAMAISLAGIALPMCLGLALTPLLSHALEPAPKSPWDPRSLGFALFLGTALSITALPILGRMMMELNITRTRLGSISITAAAVNDAAGWILLAAVTAVVRGAYEPRATLVMIGETVAFGLLMVFVSRPALRWWSARALRRGQGELPINSLAVLLVLIFVCSLATNRIGIFGIFGAFLMGAVMSAEHEFREAVSRRLHDFVNAFFLPIFFTFTGLRTDIGSLGSSSLWWMCLLVVGAAILGKFGGCALAARLSRFTTRESACVGVMMNTRGLMELIVINVGFELGVIPQSVYCMLVIMALVTTVMTTPILLRLMRGTELEPFIRGSALLTGKAVGASNGTSARSTR